MAGSLDPLANFSQANLTENTGKQETLAKIPPRRTFGRIPPTADLCRNPAHGGPLQKSPPRQIFAGIPPTADLGKNPAHGSGRIVQVLSIQHHTQKKAYTHHTTHTGRG